MTLSRCRFYVVTLFKNLFSIRGGTAFLSSLGVLYTILRFADYFRLAQQSEVQKFFWVFVFLGAVGAIWTCKPKLAVSCNLRDRDVVIEVAVGDIFSFPGAIVVGTNSTFDTRVSTELIAATSIQGQFTKKYYEDHAPLDAELSAGLSSIACEELSGQRIGKKKRYPLGTAVRLHPKSRTGYFVAITHINDHGVAEGTFEDLKDALGQLWVFIGQRGSKEALVLPVLGSGFARLTQPRPVIVQEIIKSFIAACSERTFCDKVTIVLRPKDVTEWKVDLQALHAYVQHLCTYTEFAPRIDDRVGSPVN